MTFREAFEGGNTPGDMERYLADAFTLQWQASEISDPDSTILVATARRRAGSPLNRDRQEEACDQA